MIAFYRNLPVLQVGRHQVTCYDSQWLYDGLRRAMKAANHENFPLVDEICHAMFEFLENRAPLKMMTLDSLFARMQQILIHFGFEVIAQQLRAVAPPVPVCLRQLVEENGCAMEMFLFSLLQREMADLAAAGASEVRLLHVQDCVMLVRGVKKWDRGCQRLLGELRGFLRSYDDHVQTTSESSMILHLDEVNATKPEKC